MNRRTILVGATALVASLALGACTGDSPQDAEPRAAATSAPDAPLTVLADPSEEAASLQTSRELFDAAPVVVVADEGDVAGQRLAAVSAIGLGAPLLVRGDASAEPSAAFTDELERLGTAAALVVGADANGDAADDPGDTPSTGGSAPTSDAGLTDLTVVTVEATPDAIRRVTGLAPGVDAEATVTDIAALQAPAAADGPVPSRAPDASDSPTLPRVIPGAPLTDTLALAIDGDANLASIASARAAGVTVQLVPATAPNPQASGASVDALHASSTSTTLAIGTEFAGESALDWKVRAARTGAQLPGGGQQVFGTRQYVALYGTPGTPSMGVLGEQELAGAVQRTREVAAPYQPLTDKTVVPMFEIITTVASASAGPDGNYSTELDAATLRPWIDEAAAAGIYVVLDLQPGRTDFLTQAKQYEELLKLPHVGLAIDPEWRLAPDQVHLRQIGAVETAEINTVTQWLAELTNQNSLPQKMVVLHQFRLSMIRDRASLDMSHPELAMLIHADGLGSQPDKQASWAALHKDAPAGIAWGWKNFYDEDTPMLDPTQTVQNVSPVPDLITYQ
jgi:hypothetical protein